jgi:hypothetical protein
MFNNELWQKPAGGAGGGFYTHQIANSVRNSGAQNGTLKRTAGTPTSSDTFTLSYWVKKYTNSTSIVDQNIFVAGTGGGTYFIIGFATGPNIFSEGSGGNFSRSYLTTTAMYRDTSSWYHVVHRYDSTQATSTNRIRLYVNGEQITSFSNQTMQTDIAQNEDISFINQSGVVQAFGGLAGSGAGSEGADVQMAEIVFNDGQSYGPDSYGETKNGVWIPKDPSGLTFGDNGYWLNFAASGDLGNDVSGNNNDFTVSGIAASDQMLDSPTFSATDGNMGNSATFGPLWKNPTGSAFSEGNLQATLTVNNIGVMSNWQIPLTGKWYWEAYIQNQASAHGIYIGVMPADTDLSARQEDANAGIVYYSPNGNKIFEGTRSAYGSTFTTGDMISVAVDRTANTINFAKNNSFIGTIDISGLADSEFFPYYGHTGGTGPDTQIFNFGQEGTFAGNKTAGGNADDTGYGNFFYAPPTDFLALCSGNLTTDATVDPAQTDDNYPQKLFSPLLYTGTGSSNARTGLGFKPDLTWIKERSGANDHKLTDSTRGVTKSLESNETTVEATDSNGLTAFGTDGFTVGSDAVYNNNTDTYASWNWRANGGTTSSNTEGALTSTVQVDPSGGFSIAKYTSNGSGSSFGHGLAATPSFLVVKKIDNQARNWAAWHKDFPTPTTGYMLLNLNSGVSNDTLWNNTAPTSTIITVQNGTTEVNNPSGDSYICYSFADVEGYIKAGSYIANGSATDNAFVYLGFRPAFLMVKGVVSGASWTIIDNKRNGYNPTPESLMPNQSAASYTTAAPFADLLSNGFKVRTDNAVMGATGYDPYVYLAIAENPFKYATAR